MPHCGTSHIIRGANGRSFGCPYVSLSGRESRGNAWDRLEPASRRRLRMSLRHSALFLPDARRGPGVPSSGRLEQEKRRLPMRLRSCTHSHPLYMY
jgi:hypothetical protein